MKTKHYTQNLAHYAFNPLVDLNEQQWRFILEDFFVQEEVEEIMDGNNLAFTIQTYYPGLPEFIRTIYGFKVGLLAANSGRGVGFIDSHFNFNPELINSFIKEEEFDISNPTTFWYSQATDYFDSILPITPAPYPILEQVRDTQIAKAFDIVDGTSKEAYDLAIEACASNNTQVIAFLLNKGFSLAQKHSGTSTTILYHAIHISSVEFIEYLVASGAPIKDVDSDNRNALECSELSLREDVISVFTPYFKSYDFLF